MSELSERIARLSPEKRATLEARLRATQAASPSAARIARADANRPVPSFAQERMWLLAQIDGASPLYNIPVAFDLAGTVDLDALQRSLDAIVERHEPLRTRFTERDGRLQIDVVPHVAAPIEVEDFTSAPPAERERLVECALRERARQPIDLATGPLVRALLIRESATRTVFAITVHHAAFDGWSLGPFCSELAALYSAFVAGTPTTLPELAIRYTDYAAWQREQLAGSELTRLTDYWVRQLSGSPFALELPTDRERPEAAADEGDNWSGELSLAASEMLRTFCRAEQATPFMALLTAVYVVLSRWSRATDILVGSPVAGRTAPETEPLIGLFVNTLVLRGDVSGTPSFRQLVHRVRDMAWGAFSHEAMPFEKLVAALKPPREANRSPLFQVMVTLENRPPTEMRLGGVLATGREVGTRTSKFDITLFARDAGDRLQAVIEYKTALFDAATIARFWAHVSAVLEGGLRIPEMVVHELPMVTAAEQRVILGDWNRTEAAYPRETPLAALIEAQVRRTPEATAVVCGDRRVTYRQLNAHANRLARHLQALGAGPDGLVGVCVDRSADMLAALLAVVKAGAAYLPLDPLLPPARLQYLLDDSHVSVVLTDRAVAPALAGFAGHRVLLDEGPAAAQADDDLDVAVTPDHLAYVIYTSGSTGRPKGVQVPRGALTNLLWSMRDWLGLSAQDRVLALTTMSFDIAGCEWWLPLLVGAEVVVASREAAADGHAIRDLLDRHDITFMQATPVTWRLLLEAGWPGKANLQSVCTGEACPPDLAAALVGRVPRLWNLYGPTETTIWSTGHIVRGAEAPVLIGRPIANTRCYVLDEHRQLVPAGAVGELYIGGDGLARGYLARPELTAATFLPDPFSPVPGARMYRTGDLARHRPDGTLECLGRTDHQVKIRGFRIELGEIEAALEQHADVRQAVVVAREDRPGDKRLVAYVVPAGATAPAAADLRARLKQQLPDYMVPAAFVSLPALPVSPNGKVDRTALPVPDRDGPVTRTTSRPSRNPVEFALAGIWAEVLGRRKVGIDDNFFELGGDSLLAVSVMSKVLAMFPGTRPSLALLLRAPTVAEFARFVGDGGVPVDILVKLNEGSAGRAPFFCVPGAGGNVLSMRPMALAMPNVPYYCLQAKGLDGSEPFDTIEQTARCYVEHVRKVQPAGPYYLGGGCYGGIVAFEMARMLEQAGESVGLLVLIDSVNGAYGTTLSFPRRLRALTGYAFDRLTHHAEEIRSAGGADRATYLKRRLATARKLIARHTRKVIGLPAEPQARRAWDVVQDTDARLAAVLARVTDANLLAANNFRPGRYGGKALLFKAKDAEPLPYDDGVHGWSAVIGGGIECLEVRGDHETIFVQPDVGPIADALMRALERCSDVPVTAREA